MPLLVAPIVVVLFAAWLVTFGNVVRRLWQGDLIIAYHPRDNVPWRILDIVLLGAAYILLQSLAQPLARLIVPDAAVLLQLIVASCVSNALVALLIVGVLTGVRGATRADLGCGGWFDGRDVLWGLKAFVLVVPPLFLIQLVLSIWFTGVHPIVELLQNNPSPSTVGWAFLAAVVMAPVVEELLFRVVLQGCLERLNEPSPLAEPVESSEPPRDAFANKVNWRPILVSSAIFALLHFNGGPDPVPLFFLALVLGYIYQRSHSIVPCIVLHMSLNALSLGLLLLGIGQVGAQ